MLSLAPQLLWNQVQVSDSRNAVIGNKVGRLVQMLALVYSQVRGVSAGVGGAVPARLATMPLTDTEGPVLASARLLPTHAAASLSSGGSAGGGAGVGSSASTTSATTLLPIPVPPMVQRVGSQDVMELLSELAQALAPAGSASASGGARGAGGAGGPSVGHHMALLQDGSVSDGVGGAWGAGSLAAAGPIVGAGAAPGSLTSAAGAPHRRSHHRVKEAAPAPALAAVPRAPPASATLMATAAVDDLSGGEVAGLLTPALDTIAAQVAGSRATLAAAGGSAPAGEASTSAEHGSAEDHLETLVQSHDMIAKDQLVCGCVGYVGCARGFCLRRWGGV